MVYKVPHEFYDGKLAYARELNANFLSVTEQIRDLNTNKADVELANLNETAIENIQKIALTRNIGEIVYSLVPLTNSSLHLLDGSLLSGLGSYAQFVDYIADLYEHNPDANYFTTEEDWQECNTTYGECGKFVYDSVNNTVRLPKITGFTECTTDITTLGNITEAGLPNIEGGLASIVLLNGGESSGAFSINQTFSNGVSTNTSNSTKLGLCKFNASDSNEIYGNSTTVQPQSIKVLIYIVVGTSTKEGIEVDIDNIATDLNGKADTDLTNTTDNGKILMSGMGMPSDKYVDLTLGANGSSYTAPANGWIAFGKTANGAGQFITLTNVTNSLVIAFNAHASGNIPQVYIPCAKGDTIIVNYSAGGATQRFRFIYAKGSESEVQ